MGLPEMVLSRCFLTFMENIIFFCRVTNLMNRRENISHISDRICQMRWLPWHFTGWLSVCTVIKESGLGRYDVMMEPLAENLDGIIIEFKVRNPAKEKDLEASVQNALCQIREKKYDTELETRGISLERIRHYGFAFEGKKVLIGSDAS